MNVQPDGHSRGLGIQTEMLQIASGSNKILGSSAIRPERKRVRKCHPYLSTCRTCEADMTFRPVLLRAGTAVHGFFFVRVRVFLRLGLFFFLFSRFCDRG